MKESFEDYYITYQMLFSRFLLNYYLRDPKNDIKFRVLYKLVFWNKKEKEEIEEIEVKEEK